MDMNKSCFLATTRGKGRKETGKARILYYTSTLFLLTVDFICNTWTRRQIKNPKSKRTHLEMMRT